MSNSKDQKRQGSTDRVKRLPKSIHHWSIQDEEDDFLSGKVSHSLPEFIEDE